MLPFIQNFPRRISNVINLGRKEVRVLIILMIISVGFTMSWRLYEMASKPKTGNLSPGSFGNWLRLSMNEIVRAGYQSTMDEDHMIVYIANLESNSQRRSYLKLIRVV